MGPMMSIMIKQTVTKREALLSGAALWLAMGGAVAMAQPAAQQRVAAPAPSVIQSWSLDTRVTYTDNFRRLPDTATRASFYDGVSVPLVEADVPIDPLDNTIVSTTLSGASLLQRPALTVFVSGSLRVGGYLDDASVSERLTEEAAPPPDMFGGGELLGSTFLVGDTDDTLFIDPNIAASASLRLVDNLFYVDGSVLAQEQALGRASGIGGAGIGRSTDEVIYGGVSVSPYLLREFAHGGSAEARIRGTYVGVLGEQFDSRTANDIDFEDIGNDDQISNDSQSAEALLRYDSGSLFDKLTFAVGAFARTVKEDGGLQPDISFDQLSASVDGEYEVGRGLSVIGSVGIDELTVEEDENVFGAAGEDLDDERADNLSGVFWNVGLRYSPNRRVDLSAKVGERYDGTSVNANARYRVSERIVFTADAVRQLDTGTQNFVSGSLGRQSQAAEILTRLADSQSNAAEQLVERALAFEGAGFLNGRQGGFGVNVFDRYSATVSANFLRTNFSAGVNYSESALANGDQEDLGYFFRASRALSRRMTASATARFTNSEGAGQAALVDGERVPFERDEAFYSADIAYRVGKRLSVTGQVYHATSDSSGSSGVTGTQFDYEENAVSLGLRWSF